MSNLKLVLHKGYILFKRAKATYHPWTDDIVLYLPNIMKKINNNIDDLWKTIDDLFLKEIIIEQNILKIGLKKCVQ